jgi:hypothetical protein
MTEKHEAQAAKQPDEDLRSQEHEDSEDASTFNRLDLLLSQTSVLAAHNWGAAPAQAM